MSAIRQEKLIPKEIRQISLRILIAIFQLLSFKRSVLSIIEIRGAVELTCNDIVIKVRTFYRRVPLDKEPCLIIL